jgi:hypothetical protein
VPRPDDEEEFIDLKPPKPLPMEAKGVEKETLIRRRIIRYMAANKKQKIERSQFVDAMAEHCAVNSNAVQIVIRRLKQERIINEEDTGTGKPKYLTLIKEED